ncbi:MAG: rane protein [Gammaproteobacteria bacterium]|nr:rane protein [Gammaproteobacteria bacterium]
MIKSRVFLGIVLVMLNATAEALTWDDLWLNPDQQGYRALKQNNLQQAATDFHSSEWQGVAYYRLKEYNKALAAFSKGTDATAFYNSGNALALLGRYKEAISAYDKALTLNTSFEDARFNRDLLKNVLNHTPPSAPSTQTAPPFKQRYNKTTAPSTDNAAATKNAPPQNGPQPQQNQPQRQQQSANTQTIPINANATSYQDQQHQQALQNMSDDPGGLLQQKLQRDYEQSLHQGTRL